MNQIPLLLQTIHLQKGGKLRGTQGLGHFHPSLWRKPFFLFIRIAWESYFFFSKQKKTDALIHF